MAKLYKGPQNRSASSVKVGERGQIVIPKEMREMFSISAGDVLLILADPEKGIAIPPKIVSEKMNEFVFGAGKNNKKPSGDIEKPSVDIENANGDPKNPSGAE